MDAVFKEALRAIVREEISRVMPGVGQENELLTRKEAAVELGVKENTLAVWTTKNIGPAPTKVGRCVRYRRSELEAYIAKNTMPREEGQI